ncbi:glucoamylase family protein [Ohtaekwangia koreensis]|uniref:Glycoamylase-like domain-containing protein n=1 Tax=Ohtaekwangia koreensis TaxID=688867 RepID=A0A1T5MHD6_9BACT|nr:glucoamylase family protein [Ohtaekwangia koreensis]SKC87647.1 hypothetical protein SAMN05660236_5477 [Ohtaekwangia koreensis]
MMRRSVSIVAIIVFLLACSEDDNKQDTFPDALEIESLKIAGNEVTEATATMNIPCENVVIEIKFSSPLNPSTVTSQNIYVKDVTNSTVPATISLQEENSKVIVTFANKLRDLSKHQLTIAAGVIGSNGGVLSPGEQPFYTAIDETPDFPEISDEELLTLVQKQTFKYFWDFADPVSGMARERNTSGSTVTSGGSGFGIMSIIVGIERNFITRSEGVQRLNKIVTFLEGADRFHGAWSHWINGNNGDAIPFSTKDNGGDLVETSFLVQGLITFRQYLQPSDTAGNNLINRINTIWKDIEWDWYRKNNEDVLYWHWSPTYNWDMNFPMYGYFEEQITYFLAAASPTHSIPKTVYTNGYGRKGAIKTGNTYYGYVLPLGTPSPLFWVHYSYLGLDPHFSDEFANYWEQNVNASRINYSYCVANPRKYIGYSDSCWGLTSSDNATGYDAHSPVNDKGVITPTAALSSFPYTPEESMRALKFFYYTLGDRLWGEYGFYDAFNISDGWTASSYLAIDQGPIIVMIENHRSELLWDLFESAPEVQAARTKLGFTKNE